MKPLRGIRVVELATLVAGPMAANILGRMGADVVKVERPGGDEARRIGMKQDGTSVLFDIYNRGKKSIVLDLTQALHMQRLHELCAHADVFIHSMRGDAAAAMSLDASSMKARHPDLIHCAISGFGNGPSGVHRRGVDPIVQAFSGLTEMMGHPGEPHVRCPASITDLATGQWAAIAILGALLQKRGGGGASAVDLSLVDSAMSIIAPQASAALLTGQRPPRCGSGHPSGAPHEIFETKDRPVFVSAASNEHWRALCEAMGRPQLTSDRRFAESAGRISGRDVLREEIESTLRDHPSSHWLEVFGAAGIVVSEVLGVEESVRHELAAERNWFETGTIPVVRLPVLVDGQPLVASGPAPALGIDDDGLPWAAS